ncbi:MAG: hypothetical protein EKK57_09235 [Proteobacteria bacterium]|nr:MAG: hypothetical protein EKK57_09235 [Pseudomonadota bacterium]
MRKIYLLWLLAAPLYALDTKDYINPTNCNLIIKQQNYQACYNYKLKGNIYFAYQLEAKKLTTNQPSASTKISYYPDLAIPVEFRSYPEDYTNSHYDFATMLNLTNLHTKLKNNISMATVIPFESQLQQGVWTALESHELSLTKRYGRINVLNIITYDDSPLRIGNHQIAVPSNIIKVIYNNQKRLSQCFSFHNELMINTSKNLIDYQVSCSMLLN